MPVCSVSSATFGESQMSARVLVRTIVTRVNQKSAFNAPRLAFGSRNVGALSSYYRDTSDDAIRTPSALMQQGGAEGAIEAQPDAVF